MRISDWSSDVCSSDLMNLTYSDIAREMLLREGLPPDRVVKTGSTMFEILTHFAPQIAASDVLPRLELREGGYYVVRAHREATIDSERTVARKSRRWHSSH